MARARFLVPGQLSSSSHLEDGERLLSDMCFLRILIVVTGFYSYDIPFPKASSPCAIILKIRGSTYEFYEDINTQPIVASFEISLECTLLPHQACQQNVLSL